jgi:hypothetical protein
VTGEVERKTAFEKGIPGTEAFTVDRWQIDPIRDDQALIVNVKNNVLIMLSGCVYTGIVNTVGCVKKIIGIDQVIAVLGGFHLTGPAFERDIQPTIDAIKRISPEYFVPVHCPGWNAFNRFAVEMPGKFFSTRSGRRTCSKGIFSCAGIPFTIYYRQALLNPQVSEEGALRPARVDAFLQESCMSGHSPEAPNTVRQSGAPRYGH